MDGSRQLKKHSMRIEATSQIPGVDLGICPRNLKTTSHNSSLLYNIKLAKNGEVMKDNNEEDYDTAWKIDCQFLLGKG